MDDLVKLCFNEFEACARRGLRLVTGPGRRPKAWVDAAKENSKGANHRFEA